jgi:hypothetical protein
LGSVYRVQARGSFSANSTWVDRTPAMSLVSNPQTYMENVSPDAGARFFRILYEP